jgi:Mg2+/Co2+ transporter CorB
MNAFIRPLEAQLSAFQEQSASRAEGMARIRNAETDLVSRIEELRGLLAEVEANASEWEGHHESLMALLDFEREHSLA